MWGFDDLPLPLFLNLFLHKYMYTHINTHAHVCTRVCVCVRMCVYTYLYIYICTSGVFWDGDELPYPVALFLQDQCVREEV